MTYFPRMSLFLLGFCLILTIGAVSVRAAEDNRYGQWQSSDDRLENLINELDLIIDEGARSRAAHPGFLQDLTTIIGRYRIPKRNIFFSDDFADQNFTENPQWLVSRGSFSIDANGSLYSSIAVSKPITAQDTGAESEEDRNMKILLGVLNELTKEKPKEQMQEEKTDSRAVISSAASIPNSFNLEYTFRSNSDWGSTSIGVILGNDPLSGYHLVYQAAAADDRPLQLIKYRYGRPYIIDEVRENPPNLDDGLDHGIRFTRASNGDMVVTVDNSEVLRAADLSYRDNFAGVMIANNGGSYSYDNIEFYLEQ